jgi:hypothetical protein
LILAILREPDRGLLLLAGRGPKRLLTKSKLRAGNRRELSEFDTWRRGEGMKEVRSGAEARFSKKARARAEVQGKLRYVVERWSMAG